MEKWQKFYKFNHTDKKFFSISGFKGKKYKTITKFV